MKSKKWMKRLWTLVLVFCLLTANLPFAVSATESETEIDMETEEILIPEDAIYLSTPEDVLSLADNCILDAWSREKVIVLSNDINLFGTDFRGIPTFGGTFLGQGYTISGFRLNEEQDAQGFFRYLQKYAVVDALHLKGSVQPSKNENVDIGGFVGVNSGKIRNCSFTGTVSGTKQIGAIAGSNKVSGVIENCTVNGTVYGDHFIGGIAGNNQGVVRYCINNAAVNTRVDHNSVSLGIPTGFSLENFTATESISDATNIGGIAGTSSGVIRSCENRGNIGYENMGYNVGGIAGSQIGYITDSANYGIINGSNGVGGIVGQFKPNVALNMGEDHMGDMMDQMIGMMGAMSGMMHGFSGMMDDMSDNMEDLSDSLEILEDQEELDPDTINAAINEVSASFGQMYEDMAVSGNKLSKQMETMMVSMTEMVDTMEKLNEGLNIRIIDISKEDTPENTQTKISNCVNYSEIYGETYVGGIAGIADIEDTTAENDISGQLALSTEGEMVMRLVIRDCRNTGTVSATKQFVGGIVGSMTIGAVFNGMNTGSVDALAANYVGGIAGCSETYIVDSVNRSILAGNYCVGGIAGYGTEVVSCYAITDIAAASKFAGGILGYTEALPGEEAELILNNRYYLAGTNLGGIDGIAYEGAAVPMTIGEFLSVETLDPAFRTVTVRFTAKGQEDVVKELNLGDTLSVDAIPHLEVGEHELYQWQLVPGVTSETLSMGETAQVYYVSTERLSNILFDQTYLAVFDAKNMVVASEEKTESGRALALAVGAFDKGTTLNLTNISHKVSHINGVPVQEAWQVSMADMGLEKLHYLIPESMDASRIALYVKDNTGSWVQRDFTVEGSYMIFALSQDEDSFALELLPEEEQPVMAMGIGAAAVVLLLLMIKFTKKRRNNKKGAASEAQQ